MDYYEILGVSKNASEEEIKKSYRKVSLRLHPDRNKDLNAKEDFQNLSEAYEVLSDKKKRQIYDQFGKEGLSQTGHQENMHFQNIFGNIFGNIFNTDKINNQKKIYERTVNLTLKELYLGKEFNLTVSFDQSCHICEGSGTKDKKEIPICTTCNGKGVTILSRQVNQFILQQNQVPCQNCNATGRFQTKKENECATCNGNKIVKQKDQIKLEVKKGTKFGDKIVKVHPSYTLYLHVLQKIEETNMNDFTLSDNNEDLYMKRTISLSEALYGAHQTITHLDGRKINIATPNGNIIQNASIYCLKSEGMYIFDHGKGNLYIQFNVILSEEDKKQHLLNKNTENIEEEIILTIE